MVPIGIIHPKRLKGNPLIEVIVEDLHAALDRLEACFQKEKDEHGNRASE